MPMATRLRHPWCCFQDFGDGDEPLVGAMAKSAAATSPKDVVQFEALHGRSALAFRCELRRFMRRRGGRRHHYRRGQTWRANAVSIVVCGRRSRSTLRTLAGCRGSCHSPLAKRTSCALMILRRSPVRSLPSVRSIQTVAM